MANWRDLFKHWIVERGQAYFECGQILEMEEDGTIVRAKVSGSREYQVEIHRNNGRMVQMYCDCPYAESGENCKHMAAVLVALEDGTVKDWKAALDQMPEEKLRDLLRSLAEGNNALQDRIVRMASGPGDKPEQWREDLEQIILSYSDYRGRLVYGQEYECRMDMLQYLEESLPHFLINGRIRDAAKLAMTVYDTVFSLETTDDGDGMTEVSEACRSALEEILSLADAQQEQSIFYLLHEFLDVSEWDWGSEDLEEMILALDWSAALHQKNLEWLDDNLDSWRMGQRAVLMGRMGVTNTELIAWWEQQGDRDSAYRPLLQLYEEHDLGKAIDLVREKRSREKNSDWQTRECTKTLLRLLEKAGEQAEFERELRYLVLELKCQELEYLSSLKNMTPPEQWSAVFAQMLSDAECPSDRMNLYYFEGMYTELFTELCQHPSFGAFLNYEEELRSWNPERTRTYYTEILKREMDAACQRKQYRQIIRYLEKVKTYPDGENSARKLAEYWYVCHKNRPAMKDELLKAGYPQE